MISRPEDSRTWRRGGRLGRTLIITAAIASLALAGGCEKKKKKAPPPPPPPPPPPVVEPDPVDVNALLQAMKSDARVQFPEAHAPADRALAEGVIRLTNALAKGDAATMKQILDPISAGVLDELVANGDWASETKAIEAVRVVSVSGTKEAAPMMSLIGTAIQGKDGAYLLAWQGVRAGDNWMFAAAPCQGDIKARASDFDDTSIEMGMEMPEMPDMEELQKMVEKMKAQLPEQVPEAPSTPAPTGIRKNTPAGPITIPTGPGGG
jgi:hypothetical protein